MYIYSVLQHVQPFPRLVLTTHLRNMIAMPWWSIRINVVQTLEHSFQSESPSLSQNIFISNPHILFDQILFPRSLFNNHLFSSCILNPYYVLCLVLGRQWWREHTNVLPMRASSLVSLVTKKSFSKYVITNCNDCYN